MDRIKLRVLVKGLALLLSLAAVGVILKSADTVRFLDKDWLNGLLHSAGVYAPFLFVLIGGVFTSVGLPRQFLAFVGGYTFGLFGGTALTLIGATIGCALSFAYARFLGQEFVLRKFPRRTEKLNRVLGTSPFTMTVVLRFLPVGSNLLLNLAAGVSTVPPLAYIAGSCVGYVPQTVIFTILGSGIHVDPLWNTLLSVVLFIISALLGLRLYRKYRLEKALAE